MLGVIRSTTLRVLKNSLNRSAPTETFKHEAGSSDSQLRKLQENLLQSVPEKLL